MAKKEKLKLKKVIGKEQQDSIRAEKLKMYRRGDPGLISEKTANVFKKDSVK